jgi:hypothetical protein
LERFTRQKLFNDGTRKECGKCHKIKMHNEFRKRQGRLRSICEECRNILYLVKNFRKKYKVISRNYHGKCYNCDTNITKLPALEFHHLNPKQKVYSWRSLRGKNYEATVNLLKKEDVIVLCKNCHILINSTFFQNFRSLILQIPLFLNSQEKLDFINEALNNHWFIKTKIKNDKYYKARTRYKIKNWIKKRYIIEKLYDGRCIGCCKINTKNNLPSLGFHHLNASKKNLVSKWDKISKYNITRIYDLLIEEKCVCLCSNCHSLIHSKSFINNLNDIIDPRSQILIQSIMTDYNRIENNIKNLSFENILREVSKK